jgi:hypothetical protein
VEASASTDANGRYRIRVFPGTYRVTALRTQGAKPIAVSVDAGKEVQGIDFVPDQELLLLVTSLESKLQERSLGRFCFDEIIDVFGT